MAVNSPVPVVLLVHGANHGAWCWLTVLDRLASRGLSAIAIDLPLTSFDDDVDAVRRAVAACGPSPVLVVAHSYGGLVVSAGAQDAGHLMFVAGRMPTPDELPAQSTTAWQTSAFRSATIVRDDGATMIEDSIKLLFPGAPDSIAAIADTLLRPMFSRVPETPTADPAWMSLPTTYIVCSEDLVVDPEHQRVMARRADRCIEMRCDHSPFFSEPGRLVDHIVGAAQLLTHPA